MTRSMLHCSNAEEAMERLKSVGPKTIPKFPGVILFNLLLAVNFDKNLNIYCMLSTTFEGSSSFKMYLIIIIINYNYIIKNGQKVQK